MLDRFIPASEVVERHHIRVEAPAAITLTAAREQDLFGSPLVRAIFKAREVVLGTTPQNAQRPRALLPQMLSLGWGVLGEVPGHEIVVGAVTKPWEPNVVFRALPPDAFAAFNEPGYVRIVWSLRADPEGAGRSIFRTETRAIATDPVSRARFRRYWSLASPGIGLIRRLLLRPLKSEAERRAHAAGSDTQSHHKPGERSSRAGVDSRHNHAANPVAYIIVCTGSAARPHRVDTIVVATRVRHVVVTSQRYAAKRVPKRLSTPQP